MKKKNTRQILFYVILTVGIITFLWLTFGGSKKNDKVKSYSDLRDLFVSEQVHSFQINDNNEIIILKRIPDGKGGFVKTTNDKGEEVDKTETVTYQLRELSIFYNDFEKLIAAQHDAGILKDFEYEPIPETPWWLSFLPYIGFLIIIAVFWFFMMNQATGRGGKIASFGKARAKVSTDQKKVKFSDVAGADEEKEELTEVVDFLKNPTRYAKLGARIPRGVLLVGPPGTGKTLLAKAVAGEAGVPFFSISGSDFVEMYVGVGASRVRDLFDTAKKAPASIIFIDEIDAVGRHRGAGLGGGHDEREQTLNQLLVEMDGFGSSDGVIVMAATNRPDILDPALLRPGRFDRQVTVNYPDMKGREEILKVHAKGKPIEATVDFRHVAQTTVGFTGADLANLLNEAALLAARRGKAMIGNSEINDSYMKIIVGPKKKSKVREEKDNRLTAFHEAGHAVASFFCDNSAPVKHITIIPAGRTGGVTVRIPEKDSMCQSRNEMFDDIVIALGGRVAEELNLDDISTGASNDIQQATAIARNMVVRYGMSEKLGPVLYGSEHTSDEVFLGRDFSSGSKNYSEKTAAEIDDEIRAIIEKAYARCREILSTHSDKLKKLAEYLLHAETVDGDQFKQLMENDDITTEELDAIVAEKKKKSDAENEEHRRMDEMKAAEEKQDEPAPNDSPNPFGAFPFSPLPKQDDQEDTDHNDRSDS